MSSVPGRHGLVIEDRISLLNRLSPFYNMSEFFFSLDRDTVRTANDHHIGGAIKESFADKRAYSMSVEKIREICDRLKLLEVAGSDNGSIIRKKNILRRKLLKLTRNLTEIK